MNHLDKGRPGTFEVELVKCKRAGIPWRELQLCRRPKGKKLSVRLPEKPDRVSPFNLRLRLAAKTLSTKTVILMKVSNRKGRAFPHCAALSRKSSLRKKEEG